VAHDGSKAADKAFHLAWDAAKLAGSELHSVSVAEDLPKLLVVK
jgi:nucleotide-binding universal stress UspA family protein